MFDRTVADPPPHVAELFRRYQAGEPGARRQLTIALYRHRGTRFVLDDQVFWLFKRDDRHDEEIGVCPRSMPLWLRKFARTGGLPAGAARELALADHAHRKGE